ncbi:unnamed protein product [Lactuca saligna]|uniref:EF-hand domain-containing protein n=1 Tax=Lactuca saligna TaxID=75948 RepID=A0AA36E405_LACSI|nr:unnamed protein product [Lactuca saligna]
MIFMFISLMFMEWFIYLHDLYSLIAHPLFQFIFATPATTCMAAQPREEARATEPCHVENGPGKKKELGVNPKVMMERLGTFWDPDDQRESLELEEMVNLFVGDEREPSFDEVKEAFGVYDKNNDGYIDAKELQNVLSNMGFLHISESDCERMITEYDVDKDGKISFREFLKVVEDGFC